MQKYALASAVEALAREAAEKVIDELEGNDALNKIGIQCILDNPQLPIKIGGFVKNLLAELAEIIRGYLRLISGAEILNLDSTDGTEVIAEARVTFSGYLDYNFIEWKTDVRCEPTKATRVQVYEVAKEGTFKQIYEGFGTDLDALCLSQAQIIQFAKRHSKWFHPKKYGTSFLFKVRNEYLVASLYADPSNSLRAGVLSFSHAHVWDAVTRHRFVVPQQALVSA
jgi:hypothetical protein